ncbi:unnamed protein product, partial [Oppiella nova]
MDDPDAIQLQHVQAQVDDVLVLMRDNFNRVLERDYRLSDLRDRADALEACAQQFQQHGHRLNRQYLLANIKANKTLIIGGC